MFLYQPRQRSRSTGQHDVIDAVVGRTGEEKLQSSLRFPGPCSKKRTQDCLCIVCRQIGISFFNSASSTENPYWRAIIWVNCAPPKAVTFIKCFSVADDLHTGCDRPISNSATNASLTTIWHGLNQTRGGHARSIRFNVNDDRLQSSRFGQTLPVLHLFSLREAAISTSTSPPTLRSHLSHKVQATSSSENGMY